MDTIRDKFILNINDNLTKNCEGGSSTSAINNSRRLLPPAIEDNTRRLSSTSTIEDNIRRSSSTPVINNDNSRRRFLTRKQSYSRTNTPIQVNEVFVCDKFVNNDYFDEICSSRNK